MDASVFDPDERAREKAASRERDERLMAEGSVSPLEMQRRNGGSSAIFRTARIKPRRERRRLSFTSFA